MVIHIYNTAISIPTAISNWANENEDNKFEFNVMIEQIKNAYEEKYKDLKEIKEEYEKEVDYLCTKYPYLFDKPENNYD